MLGVVKTNNYQNGFSNLTSSNPRTNTYTNVNRIVYRGEIYYADLGVVTGSEQGGIRPVVIIQNNSGNRFSTTVIVATLTTRTKKKLPTHVTLSSEQTGLNQENILLLEQIRTLDKTRLQDVLLGKCNEEAMKNIDEAIMTSLGISFDEVEGYLKEQQIKRVRNMANNLIEIDEFILEEKMEKVHKMLLIRNNMHTDLQNLCKDFGVNIKNYYNSFKFDYEFNKMYNECSVDSQDANVAMG